MIKRFITLIIFFIIVGCASFSKKEFKNNYIKLNEKSLAQITGVYKLYPKKMFGKQNLYNHPDSLIRFTNLYQEFIDEDWKTKKKSDSLLSSTLNYYVKLNLKDNSLLQITLLEENKILRDTVFSGKLKNGMFYIENVYFKCWGVPYVFGGCSNNKRRVAISNDLNLIVNTAVESGGSLLIIFGDGVSYNESYEFERVK